MQNIPFKNISSSKSSDERDLEELVSELRELVSIFTSSDIFRRDIFNKSDENHFTETFIKFSQNEKIKSRFSYMNQASLPNRRSSDIGVFLKTDSEHYIFCIEAKFLPPTDYVTGEYAAIKRYKKGEHGLSNRNSSKAKQLSESAIIGYSKSGDLKGHLNTINDTIAKLAIGQSDKFGLYWQDSEQLECISLSQSAILVSTHPRKDQPEIKLHHFWVEIQP